MLQWPCCADGLARSMHLQKEGGFLSVAQIQESTKWTATRVKGTRTSLTTVQGKGVLPMYVHTVVVLAPTSLKPCSMLTLLARCPSACGMGS